MASGPPQSSKALWSSGQAVEHAEAEALPYLLLQRCTRKSAKVSKIKGLWTEHARVGQETAWRLLGVTASTDSSVADGGIRPGADAAVCEACLGPGDNRWRLAREIRTVDVLAKAAKVCGLGVLWGGHETERLSCACDLSVPAVVPFVHRLEGVL